MSSYFYKSSHSSTGGRGNSNGDRNNQQSNTMNNSTTPTSNGRRRFGEAPMAPQDVAREMSSIQREIEELDQRLESAESQENEELDKVLDDVAQTTKRQIQDGVDSIATSFRLTCENQLANLNKRQEDFNVQHRNELGRYQENIFKTNRVFREVSRYLRDDWPQLFKILMAKHPRDRVEQELLLIEGEKPIMQPYNALVRWKEMNPEEFSLDRLVQVLNDSGLFEAANKARIIMCEEGGYIRDPSAVVSLPQVQSSRVAEILERAGHRAHGSSDELEAASPVRNPAGASYTTKSSGPVSNRKLLLLSKKVGDKWQRLGQRLGVPDSEMQDISDLMDGDSQQCAFQTLYKWRDNTSGSDQEIAEELAQALSSLGLGEQAKDFRS